MSAPVIQMTEVNAFASYALAAGRQDVYDAAIAFVQSAPPEEVEAGVITDSESVEAFVRLRRQWHETQMSLQDTLISTKKQADFVSAFTREYMKRK